MAKGAEQAAVCRQRAESGGIGKEAERKGDEVGEFTASDGLARLGDGEGAQLDKDIGVFLLKRPDACLEVGNAAFPARFEGDDVPEHEVACIARLPLLFPQRIGVFVDPL